MVWAAWVSSFPAAGVLIMPTIRSESLVIFQIWLISLSSNTRRPNIPIYLNNWSYFRWWFLGWASELNQNSSQQTIIPCTNLKIQHESKRLWKWQLLKSIFMCVFGDQGVSFRTGIDGTEIIRMFGIKAIKDYPKKGLNCFRERIWNPTTPRFLHWHGAGACNLYFRLFLSFCLTSCWVYLFNCSFFNTRTAWMKGMVF